MKFLSTLSLFLLSIISYSQQCGSDFLIGRNPLLETRNSSPCYDVDTTTQVTIPVVFHIIHLGETDASNISDSQVLGALDNLNDRFRANPDGVGVTENTIDSRINFCLAQRTPEGESTTGITRHDGSDFVFEGQSYAASGVRVPGSSGPGIDDEWLKTQVGCWDVANYCNIYVVTEINNGSSTRGYAYLGYIGDCREGIVVRNGALGLEGTVAPNTDKNVVLAHEMGHYLDLYHTFHLGGSMDGCDDTIGVNCCTSGDRVCDTPDQWKQGVSCSGNFCDQVPVNNIMDYGSEECKDMFTPGQIKRMRSHIFDERTPMISIENLACVDPNGACQYDFNEDGIISSPDLLLVIGEFGCASGCEYDLDGDGSVGSADLLLILGLFGTCSEIEPTTPTQQLGQKFHDHTGFYILYQGKKYDLSGRPLD